MSIPLRAAASLPASAGLMYGVCPTLYAAVVSHTPRQSSLPPVCRAGSPHSRVVSTAFAADVTRLSPPVFRGVSLGPRLTQGVVTPICAVLTAETEVTEPWILSVTGLLRFIEASRDPWEGGIILRWRWS